MKVRILERHFYACLIKTLTIFLQRVSEATVELRNGLELPNHQSSSNKFESHIAKILFVEVKF